MKPSLLQFIVQGYMSLVGYVSGFCVGHDYREGTRVLAPGSWSEAPPLALAVEERSKLRCTSFRDVGLARRLTGKARPAATVTAIG